MKTILPWVVVCLLAGTLYFAFSAMEEKKKEVIQLRQQMAELATLRTEVEKLKQVQISSAEVARLRKENVELLQLRNQVSQLKKENASFASKAGPSSRPSAIVESQSPPQTIEQLMRENQQLRSEVQELNVLRERNSQSACINSLRQLDGATEQWAIENKKVIGDTVTAADIAPYLKQFPVCPQGGQYTVGPVGSEPTCSIPGHVLPQ